MGSLAIWDLLNFLLFARVYISTDLNTSRCARIHWQTHWEVSVCQKEGSMVLWTSLENPNRCNQDVRHTMTAVEMDWAAVLAAYRGTRNVVLAKSWPSAMMTDDVPDVPAENNQYKCWFIAIGVIILCQQSLIIHYSKLEGCRRVYFTLEVWENTWVLLWTVNVEVCLICSCSQKNNKKMLGDEWDGKHYNAIL